MGGSSHLDGWGRCNGDHPTSNHPSPATTGLCSASPHHNSRKQSTHVHARRNRIGDRHRVPALVGEVPKELADSNQPVQGCWIPPRAQLRSGCIEDHREERRAGHLGPGRGAGYWGEVRGGQAALLRLLTINVLQHYRGCGSGNYQIDSTQGAVPDLTPTPCAVPSARRQAQPAPAQSPSATPRGGAGCRGCQPGTACPYLPRGLALPCPPPKCGGSAPASGLASPTTPRMT